MHTLHYVAVEADDKEHAALVAESLLEDMNGEWFDWFVVGGGRWNEQSDELGLRRPTNMIISAQEDSTAFKDKINELMQWRKETFEGYKPNLSVSLASLNNLVENYDPTTIDFGETMHLYEVRRLTDMAMGIWNSDSFFFDLTNDTTNPKYTLQAIDKDPEFCYIVPIDFHF